MNTQAMSAQFGAIDLSDIEEQRNRIPDLEKKEMNLLSDASKVELKQLINEVLDEREYKHKLDGPYDMIEEFPDDASYDWV